ncbi:hypothetical protein STRCI_006160 [Streptomyces cinnabarinus]|uniref:Uncharacterized protein n=1 Tax=Streptomyces cinnabarinus TaxID=67287 RepID=A0ABY7KM10_9ACTN|nr:hypothetical protein [Streptomyces cinnabarinus]WAZ24715.1 hypothetical protein STRCI_006160 [Streptomyces cinnabarinus]
MFAPAAWAAYALLVLATVVALVREPALRPDPGQVFFTDSLLTVQLVLLVGQTAGIAWHEAFHDNRGDVRAARGDLDGAVEDFGYAQAIL